MEFLPHYVKYITDESEKDVNELKERLNSELQAMIHDVEALKLQQMSEREELQDQVDELEAKYRMKGERASSQRFAASYKGLNCTPRHRSNLTEKSAVQSSLSTSLLR